MSKPPTKRNNGDGMKLLVVQFISDNLELILETLLKTINRGYETGCNKRCGCRKHGLKCSKLCTNCYDIYSNTDIETLEDSSSAEGDFVVEVPETCRNVENDQIEVDNDLEESCINEVDS